MRKALTGVLTVVLVGVLAAVVLVILWAICLGGFAVSTGFGEEAVIERFARANDDYSKILSQSLADRLAEAFAEYLHEQARRGWYETGPELSKEELIGGLIEPQAGSKRAEVLAEWERLRTLSSADRRARATREDARARPDTLRRTRSRAGRRGGTRSRGRRR